MTEEKEVATEQNGHNKEEHTTGDESELDSGIIRQVEYYFSDVNLPRDKFLREQVQLDDGWVPLEILIRFNRLAKLTTDLDVIAKALNKSTSGLLEVSDDNKKVRRNPEQPLPEMNEEHRKEVMDRTIYAKGFSKETTLDTLLKFFKPYEQVENIIMRKYQDKASKKRIFKGSVFATFKTKEQAEKFLEIKDLKYEDTDLITMCQEKYVKQKQEEYAAKKEKRDKKGNKPENDAPAKSDIKLPSGTVLFFSGCKDTIKREVVKESLEAIGGEVAYIDFKLGDTEGYIRLAKQDTAKEVFEKLTDGKLSIEDNDVTFKLVEGEEENAYLVKSVEDMMKRRKTQKQNSKQNRGRGNRGGGWQNRKRKQDNNDGSPPAKIRAEES